MKCQLGATLMTIKSPSKRILRVKNGLVFLIDFIVQTDRRAGQTLLTKQCLFFRH